MPSRSADLYLYYPTVIYLVRVLSVMMLSLLCKRRASVHCGKKVTQGEGREQDAPHLPARL